MSSRAKSGFTLIELLIYTGILVIFVTVIGSTLLAISKTYHSIAAEQSLEQSAEGAFGRMVREIRQAKSINGGSSTFGSSPGTLSLSTTDASGTAETIVFFVSSGALHLRRNGTDVGPLMPASVDIQSLIFRSITAGSSSAVKIELTVESGTSSAYRSGNFYETAVLRGSYLQ